MFFSDKIADGFPSNVIHPVFRFVRSKFLRISPSVFRDRGKYIWVPTKANPLRKNLLGSKRKVNNIYFAFILHVLK